MNVILVDLKKNFWMISPLLEEVPPEMILNWDQSGIKLVPSFNWTLKKQGSMLSY